MNRHLRIIAQVMESTIYNLCVITKNCWKIKRCDKMTHKDIVVLQDSLQMLLEWPSKTVLICFPRNRTMGLGHSIHNARHDVVGVLRCVGNPVVVSGEMRSIQDGEMLKVNLRLSFSHKC